MQSFRYFGEQVELGLRSYKYHSSKNKHYCLWLLLKKTTLFYQSVKQMEKNIKLGKVWLMTAAQHLVHALQEIELHALVYVHQH